MDNLSTIFEQLRPSQARRHGFESRHPLFFQKDGNSKLDLSLKVSIIADI